MKLLGSYIQRKFDPKTLPKDPSKEVPGTFYHGIILRKGELGWYYAAPNLLESGMLQTPNYVAYWDTNFALYHRPIRAYVIKDIQYNLKSGGLTPRAMNFINIASGIRNGLSIQMGSTKFSNDQKKEIMEISRAEIKFEIGRRKYAKDAVSRLECLYVADNKSTIEEMFDHDRDLFIFKVKIAEALNCTRVDSKWYEEYRKTKNKKCIKKYWGGIKYDEKISTWEYLVDGLIVADDPKQLVYLNSCKEELEEELKCKIGNSSEKSLIIAYNQTTLSANNLNVHRREEKHPQRI